MSKGLLEEFNFKFPCNVIFRSLPGQSDILRFAMHVFKLYDYSREPNNVQKVKFSIKGFFSKCDQIRSLLRIWSHLLKKSLMENFIFCAMKVSQDPLVVNYFRKKIHLDI